jgi:2-polyprenyl-3-methyl-5-hydroxy-6-metoxy-1,4-benzoquinol methylase
MDVRSYNRQAWDKLVESGDRWTVPVTTDEIQRAKKGEWQIVLTPTKPVPKSWFPDLHGASTLCLASGGGQQGPILAAAGAVVAVLDASPLQLKQDREVGERDGLSLETIEGDMADLSLFADATFDLIVHPCSNCFVPDIRPVWRECFVFSAQAASCWPGSPTPSATFSTTNAWKMGAWKFDTRSPTPT